MIFNSEGAAVSSALPQSDRPALATDVPSLSGWFDAALVWLSFLVYSALSAPVPALNEPHYLSKARHFWQPTWCAGDMFLESADAHVVFFATLGWFTTWCSLPVAAWIGRAISLAMLAGGWTTLSRRLSALPWVGVTSAWLFLTLQTIGNWSGEWLVGGVESKIITYGLLFFAWAKLADGRWRLSAAAMGVAIAFHPVVGLWGVLATGFAAVGCWLTGVSTRPSWVTLFIAIILMGVVSMPGMIPALRLILQPVDPQVRYAGTYLQVFYRLNHHLDPMMFPARAYAGYAMLMLVWGAGLVRGPRTAIWWWLHGIVGASLLFAIAGLAVGWGPRPASQMIGFDWRMHLLKFYPFRLADALLPAMVAWQWARGGTFASSEANSKCESPRGLTSPRSPGYVTFLAAMLFCGSLWQVHRAASAERYAFVHDPAWRDVCAWMKSHTPPDVLVHTPHYSWTFKWFAERPEYVNFKDCPQDTPGIVEWNRRLLLLTKQTTLFLEDGLYTRDELRSLRKQTGITHIVTDKLGPMELPPVYHNATFQVYDLRELDAPAPRTSE